MMPWFLGAALVLALAVLSVFAALFLTFGNHSAIEDGAVLNGFATAIRDTMVCSFMFETGPGQIALVDAGVDPVGKAILAALAKKGLGPEAVRAVFLTHGDRDHTAACPLFKNAKIYCPEADMATALGRGKSKKPVSFMLKPRRGDFEVTNVLKDGETVEAGSVALRVFAVPGHTPGSSAFLAGGVLFMGDCANADKQGRLRGAHFLFSENMGLNRESLKALARRLKPLEKKVKVLAPAHTGSLAGLKPLLDLVGGR